MSKQNTYELVTERLLTLMSKGDIPWVKPWSGGHGLGETQNLITGHKYRGINALLTMGFGSPFFCTFKQATQIGAYVRKGEKGTPVVYWGSITKESETDPDDKKSLMFQKHYIVFNSTQLEGLSPKLQELIAIKVNPPELKPIPQNDRAERVILETRADIKNLEVGRAYYKPTLDYINLPPRDSFVESAEYYSTAFHELGHWTGHASRLNRKELTEASFFGSHTYSKEELTAELTAAFVCSQLNISTESSTRNSAAYLQSWMRALKGDPKMLTHAAQRAQKAADLILKVKTEPKIKVVA